MRNGDVAPIREEMHPEEAPPMHVGLYSPAWPPGAEANGIVTYVRIVADELVRQGHRVSIFSALCDANAGPHVHRVEWRPRPRWVGILRRVGIVRQEVYDFGKNIAEAVGQVHSIDPIDVFEMEESFGWFADVARRLRLPVVVKLHGPAFLSLVEAGPHASETPGREQRIQAEGRALRSAAWIVAPSQSTLADTVAKFTLEGNRFSSIPNPVYPMADPLIWRADDHDAGHVLFVGRFDYRKGGDAVIRAFALLAAARPEVRLIFAGPDAGLTREDGSVQHIADFIAGEVLPEVAARIRFLGSRPGSEIQRLRRRCALTVFTTRWESFGYAVAEAMTQGCPLVAFDVDGVNELVTHGQTGLLAPLDDIDALSKLMLRLLDNPAEAAALGEQARHAINKKCGAQEVARQMVELFHRAVAAPAAAA